jgi:hypothetical protein
MNCRDCEQLFDAHLDGALGGTLRLEFDAHRLRCQRCQQSLAMLETVGHVIGSSHDPVPALADDFTARVMGAIGQRRPLRMRLRPTRVALVIGGVLQAAAVLTFAIMLPSKPAGTAAPSAPATGAAPETYAGGYLKADIFARINTRLREMSAAGRDVKWELFQLAQYANTPLPDDIARATAELGTANPWTGFLQALLPPMEEDPDRPSTDSDQFSL